MAGGDKAKMQSDGVGEGSLSPTPGPESPRTVMNVFAASRVREVLNCSPGAYCSYLPPASGLFPSHPGVFLDGTNCILARVESVCVSRCTGRFFLRRKLVLVASHSNFSQDKAGRIIRLLMEMPFSC